MKQLRELGAVVILAAAIFSPAIASAQAPPPPAGLPDLVGALKATPGVLGVDAGQMISGKQVIFAWFEDMKTGGGLWLQACKKWTTAVAVETGIVGVLLTRRAVRLAAKRGMHGREGRSRLEAVGDHERWSWCSAPTSGRSATIAGPIAARAAPRGGSPALDRARRRGCISTA